MEEVFNGMNDFSTLGVLSKSTIFSPQCPPSVASTGPLVMLRQNSLSVEQVYKNGISKRVHVVVKNHPFLLQVGLSGPSYQGQRLDFHRFPVEARLVYDCDQFKEVAFVKMKPIEFKSNVNDRGDQVTVEIRPKVLTSQLEDMLFRVKIVVLDPTKPHQHYSVLSEPVRVVSKPEQVKKKKAPAAPKPKKEIEKKQPEEPKRPVEELLAEHLAKIESNVNQQEVLLNILTSRTSRPRLDQDEEVQRNDKRKHEEMEPAEPLTPFEQSVMDLLEAFNRLDEVEKPMKLRRLVKTANAGDIATFTEMIETVSVEASKKPVHTCNNKNKDPNIKGCQCDTCPHKEELKRIDEFYNRLLTNPEGILI